MEQLIKPKVLAQKWNVSVRTLTRMEKSGKLTPVWIGRRKRYRLSDIESYIAEAMEKEDDASEPDISQGDLAGEAS